MYGDLEGVKGDGARVLGNIEVDSDSTIILEVGEVGLEGQVVVRRDDIGGEELATLGRVLLDAAVDEAGLSSAHVVSTKRAVLSLAGV